MISAGDFRNGVSLEIEGNVYQILEFQHVKPGKGAAFVRTKLKNIINGGAFGFEGSVLCTALMIIAIAIILKIQSRKVNQRL